MSFASVDGTMTESDRFAGIQLGQVDTRDGPQIVSLSYTFSVTIDSE